MEQYKPVYQCASLDNERYQSIVESFKSFENIAAWSDPNLGYTVFDRELFLSPVELTTRWINLVSKEVSIILSQSEDTLKMSGQKKELAEDFHSFALTLFISKIKELPIYKKIFIQFLSLKKADIVTQDRAIASLTHIPILQFNSLIALLASEPAIEELIHDLELKYIPGPKNDPKWWFFAVQLNNEKYIKTVALQDQFPDLSIGKRIVTLNFSEESELSINLRQMSPILHIPEKLADRYQLAYASPDAVLVIRQRFINTFSKIPLIKKYSFPTPRLPNIIGSKKLQNN